MSKRKGLSCAVPAISTVQISWPYEERDCSAVSAGSPGSCARVTFCDHSVLMEIEGEPSSPLHHALMNSGATRLKACSSPAAIMASSKGLNSTFRCRQPRKISLMSRP